MDTRKWFHKKVANRSFYMRRTIVLICVLTVINGVNARPQSQKKSDEHVTFLKMVRRVSAEDQHHAIFKKRIDALNQKAQILNHNGLRLRVNRLQLLEQERHRRKLNALGDPLQIQLARSYIEGTTYEEAKKREVVERAALKKQYRRKADNQNDKASIQRRRLKNRTITQKSRRRQRTRSRRNK